MNRFLAAFRMDVTVQFRNKLYVIGIGVGILIAVVLSQLANPGNMSAAVPTAMLLIVGGSTLLYVAGMIIFERDEGTLSAVFVSPLRISEYLWSKIITLTGLATIEAVIMIGGATLIMGFSTRLSLPNIPVLLTGIIALGIMYTLVGIILIVRYDTISKFLLPMGATASILQLPFLYFLGVIEHPAFLAIPTSAPTVLIKGAYVHLAAWEWVYGITYTAAITFALTIWAYRAFHKHMIMRKAN